MRSSRGRLAVQKGVKRSRAGRAKVSCVLPRLASFSLPFSFSFSFSSRYSSRLLLSALFMANGCMKYELRLLQKSPSPRLAISPSSRGQQKSTAFNFVVLFRRSRCCGTLPFYG